MAKVYTYIPPKIKDKAKVDISHLASKEELKDGIQEAKNYTNEEIKKLNSGANHTHANKSALDKLTESNGDLFFNGKNLSGYATKDELNNKADKSSIPTKVSQLENDNGYITTIPSEYITESELNNKGYLTEHQDLSGYATKDELNNKADKSSIPTKEELMGEKGEKGDNGVTPNITIGTVTTLEPNQQASVTRRGTDTNPIFDFGIPKGEKGEGGVGGGSIVSAELEHLHTVTLEEDVSYIEISIDNKDEVFVIFENVLFTISGGMGVTVNEKDINNQADRVTRGSFFHTSASSRGNIHLKHQEAGYYSVSIVGMNTSTNDGGSGIGFVSSRSEKIYTLKIGTNATASKKIAIGSKFEIYGR